MKSVIKKYFQNKFMLLKHLYGFTQVNNTNIKKKKKTKE